MVEIEHRVNGKKVRIPLAGPANRQGRIAAENALGGTHSYKGSIGTSVVRVFEAVAGITGFSLKQARAAGIDADAVVVHKEHHTSYYPGAETVTTMLIYDRNTGIILGGQAAGYKGADKRLDVIATATAAKLTIGDLADIDFAYSPPIGTANDAINMAAYTAENRISGFSPSVTVSELDAFIEGENPVFIDVRDIFAFEKSHIKGAIHIPLELFAEQINTIPEGRMVIVYDETGKKGHQALRTLLGAGYKDVTNVSGGHTSLQRQARTVGFKHLEINLLQVESKSLEEETNQVAEKVVENVQDFNSPVVVDVRTPEEFEDGAYPDAINIPLDELIHRYEELGNNETREIVVYCASGARSSYAQQMLMNLGYAKVTNGGGLASMMANRTKKPAVASSSVEPMVVDVRTSEEFRGGAYPGAINIPLDELQVHIKEFDDVKIPLADIQKKYPFEVIIDKVTEIHAARNEVICEKNTLTYDYLVIAFGAEKIQHKGINHTLSICAKPEMAVDIRNRIDELVQKGSGKIAIGFGGNPKDKSAVRGGPAFELMFNIHNYLKNKKLRENFELTFFAPMDEPGAKMGKGALAMMDKMFTNYKINKRFGKKIKEFVSDGVIFEDDSKLDSDLVIFIAAGTGPAALKTSDLTLSESGFIKIDNSGQAAGFPNVYAIGDIAALEGPDWIAKQGHIAELMGRNAAFNIIETEKGSDKRKGYQEHLNILCVMDTGNGAAFVFRDGKKAFMIPMPVVGCLLYTSPSP